MKRFDACGAHYEEGCLADYEEANQIEVDRDIKAANLQLLVDAVMAYNDACVACEDGGNDGADVYEAEQTWIGLLDLARGLKQ